VSANVVLLADRGQDPDDHHVRAHAPRPLVRPVEAEPDRFLQLREDAALEEARRDVDQAGADALPVGLASLARETVVETSCPTT
jgi:hypothetical protein